MHLLGDLGKGFGDLDRLWRQSRQGFINANATWENLPDPRAATRLSGRPRKESHPGDDAEEPGLMANQRPNLEAEAGTRSHVRWMSSGLAPSLGPGSLQTVVVQSPTA